MEKVIIFGASAGARLIYYSLAQDSSCQVVGFTVDRSYIKEPELCGLPVIPFEEVESIYPPSECKMLVAVLANRINKTREEKYLQAKAKGYQFISHISSKATTYPDLVIGEEYIVMFNPEDSTKLYYTCIWPIKSPEARFIENRLQDTKISNKTSKRD